MNMPRPANYNDGLAALAYFDAPFFRFVRWRSVDRPDGKKPIKKPVNAAGMPVSALDERNQLDYAAAAAWLKSNPENAVGVLLGNGLVGLDMDGCRDASTGEWAPWANDLSNAFPAGAYREISTSGTGGHILSMCNETLPDDLRNKFTPDGAPKNAAEFYSTGRWFALGSPIGGHPSTAVAAETVCNVVPKRAARDVVAIEELNGPALGYSGPVNDEELLRLMTADGLSHCGVAFDLTKTAEDVASAMYGGDGSSADMGFANHLAYFTGGDLPRMVRLYMQSVHGKRDKAQKRPQYVQDTCADAARMARRDGRFINKPSVDSLAQQFLAHPDDFATVAADVARLSTEDRKAFVELTYKGAPNHTKAELTKAVQTAVVETRKAATVERGLVADAKGNPVQNLENARRILLNDPVWAGVFCYSEFSQKIVVSRPLPNEMRQRTHPRELDDGDGILVQSWFQSNGFPQMGDAPVWGAMKAAAMVHSFHEVRDYLTSVKWDGTPRLHALFNWYFPCQIEHHIAGHAEYLQTAGRRFCIGAVARIMQAGCKLDHMPVLSGEQGLGKSTGFEALFSKPWVSNDMPDVTSKDAKDHIQGVWFAEWAELSSMNGRDVNHVKNFMSTAQDRFRSSYGRNSQTHKRQCVFGGTVNGDEYLHDTTGGRRFWPMCVSGRVNVAAIEADRDQLWAEAVALYEVGEKWWFDQGECQALEQTQEGARTVDIGEDRVREWLLNQPDRVTARQIADALFDRKDDKSMSMRTSRYLKSCGWVPVANTDGQRWWGRGAKALLFAAPQGANVVSMYQPQGMVQTMPKPSGG